MWGLEQAERFEIGHRAPDGGRADLEPVAADERLRADRDRGQDVILDHGSEHGPLPLGQVNRRAMGGGWQFRACLFGAFWHFSIRMLALYP